MLRELELFLQEGKLKYLGLSTLGEVKEQEGM